MKKALLLSISLFFTGLLSAQSLTNYSFKIEYMRGIVFKHNKHLQELVKGPAQGFALSVERQVSGSEIWHNYFNLPSVGASLGLIDLGNTEMLGQALTLYPYIQLPLLRNSHLELYARPGAGLAFVNKYYANTPHQSGTLNGINGKKNAANGAIGSALNAFLAFGGSAELKLNRYLSLTADCAWNHLSNGSIIQPNSGINMLNAYIGLKYQPGGNKPLQKTQSQFSSDFAPKFSIEVSLAGGIRQLYYKDKNNYGIASASLGIYRPLTAGYRMGMAADLFYDAVFGYINAPDGANRYQRTYVEKDEMKNKIRAGLSWQHELIFGRFTAGLHLGIYLYDPIKALEPYSEKGRARKGIIYPYNIDKEDGWLYTRASAKYRIGRGLFAVVGLKTHLQKAEFIEWGLGYSF